MIAKETRVRKGDNHLVHIECGLPIRRIRRRKTKWADVKGWHPQKSPIKFTRLHRIKNDILLNKEKWEELIKKKKA